MELPIIMKGLEEGSRAKAVLEMSQSHWGLGVGSMGMLDAGRRNSKMVAIDVNHLKEEREKHLS